jgi:hypothetical protein
MDKREVAAHVTEANKGYNVLVTSTARKEDQVKEKFELEDQLTSHERENEAILHLIDWLKSEMVSRQFQAGFLLCCAQFQQSGLSAAHSKSQARARDAGPPRAPRGGPGAPAVRASGGTRVSAGGARGRVVRVTAERRQRKDETLARLLDEHEAALRSVKEEFADGRRRMEEEIGTTLLRLQREHADEMAAIEADARAKLEAQWQGELDELRVTWERKIADVRAKIDARQSAKANAERFLAAETAKQQRQIDGLRAEISNLNAD